MPSNLEQIRYYGNLIVKLEKSSDKESVGALRYFKNKLNEAIRDYVREENVA